MKFSQMNSVETSKMFTKFFQFNNFDLKKVALHFKKTEKQVQMRLKEEIKNLLIDLEGQLLRAKRICEAVFINSMNPRIINQLLNLDKILDKKSCQDLFTYYRSRFNEFNINQPHHLETVFPISIDSRLKIYQEFVQYCRSKHLFNSHPPPPETEKDIIKKGFTDVIKDIYLKRQLDLLYVLIKKNKLNIGLVCEQFVSRGLTEKKFQRNVVEFKVANLILLGLYRVYKLTSQWMDNNILRWNKFIKCYANICLGWSEQNKETLIKIAIYDSPNSPSVSEIKQFTFLMGWKYVNKFGKKTNSLENTKQNPVPRFSFNLPPRSISISPPPKPQLLEIPQQKFQLKKLQLGTQNYRQNDSSSSSSPYLPLDKNKKALETKAIADNLRDQIKKIMAKKQSQQKNSDSYDQFSD